MGVSEMGRAKSPSSVEVDAEELEAVDDAAALEEAEEAAEDVDDVEVPEHPARLLMSMAALSVRVIMRLGFTVNTSLSYSAQQ